MSARTRTTGTRTTLTIEEDVAALIEQVREQRGGSFKEVVNEALRLGLRQLREPSAPVRVYHTRTVSLGRPRLPDLDNVAEALAVVENDRFR